MHSLLRKSCGLAVLLAAALTIHGEVLLNSTISQDQERQSLGQLTAGTVVAVYEDESLATGRILLRRFNSALASPGIEQRVDLASGTERREPVLAPLAGGGFVVAYSATGLDADKFGVAFRRYDAAGLPLHADETPANTITRGSQFRPQIAALTNGGFVLCWVGPGADSSQDIFYRRFSASGTPVDAAEVVANALGSDPVTGGDQGAARVAALRDGGFVIVYEDRSSDDVYGVRFSSAGTAIDAPGEAVGNKQFLLSVSAANEQSSPAVAGLAGGGFVATFNNEPSGASSRRVTGRVFGTNGVGGAEFTIGSHTNRWQDAVVTGLPNGDFAVAWQARLTEANPANTSWTVFEQSFSRLGFPRLAPTQVNTFDLGNQDTPSIAALSDSSYVIAWESFGQDSSGYGVLAQGHAPILPSPGILSIHKVSGNVKVSVNFVGDAGRDHDLQSSSNLVAWSTILTTNPPAGAFEYLEPHDQKTRAYRVQSH